MSADILGRPVCPECGETLRSHWRGRPCSPERSLEVLATAGLVRPVRRTADGQVTEYELTHDGRVLLGRAKDQ